MKEVITVGIDIAKHIFQVHGVSAQGDVVVRRKLRRSEVSEFFERLGDQGGRETMPFVAHRILVHGGELTANAIKET